MNYKLWIVDHHGLISVPSRFLTCQFDLVVIGYLAASFSLTSTPSPGTSLTYIYPSLIVGHPENTSCVLSEKFTASWIPKFQTVRSMCAFAAWPTGETSPGPCHAVLMLNHSPSLAIFIAGVIPPICET